MGEDVITYAQLMAAGWSDRRVRLALKNGEIRRLRRGAYRVGLEQAGRDEHHLAMIDAAMPLLDPATVVSHASAALLWGMPLWRADLSKVWVTRSHASHGQISQSLHSLCCPLSAEEVRECDGIPVTSISRTAVDLARHCGMDAGIVALDWARRNGTSAIELGRVIEHGRRRPGNARARRVVALASPLAESPAESVSRLRMHQRGLPRPVEQYEVLDAAGGLIARSDFAWPELRLLGECDGRVKYQSEARQGAVDAMLAEKQRERRLRDRGWDVVRWDPRDLDHPAAFAAMLRRAMARAQRVASTS